MVFGTMVAQIKFLNSNPEYRSKMAIQWALMTGTPRSWTPPIRRNSHMLAVLQTRRPQHRESNPHHIPATLHQTVARPGAYTPQQGKSQSSRPYASPVRSLLHRLEPCRELVSHHQYSGWQGHRNGIPCTIGLVGW